MKFMSILLKEGRREDLKKKYAKKFEGGTGLDFILNISDLVDFNHKYTDWVLKNVDPASENFDDDVEYIVELIKDFDKYQSQFPKKDINQYVSVSELEAVVNFVRKKKKEKELENQIDKIYEDDKFLVVKPKTEEASCKYGANTKWCTTSKGTGHFQNYTKGVQALYYVINKKNSTDKNYSKIAIHFNPPNPQKYWDSEDNSLSKREVDIINYAFPEMTDAIKNHYESQVRPSQEIFLEEVFNNKESVHRQIKDYLNTNNTLKVEVGPFETILDEKHAQGVVKIILGPENEEGQIIDAYDLFIVYTPKTTSYFAYEIGFQGKEPDDEWNYKDLGLENWNISVDSSLYEVSASLHAEKTKKYIAQRILDKISTDPALTSMMTSKRVWRPNISYGYTFGKNKGLIKKLVNWLGDERNASGGTKLDFLVDIGKLDKKIENGKKLYSQKGKNEFFPSINWRGHFSSFFASAKNAGILDYRKVGNQYFLVKGPNYDAFLKGDLKAF